MRHQFTPEESVLGGKSRGKVALKVQRSIEKQLGIKVTAQMAEKVLDAVIVYVSTPVGQAFITLLASFTLGRFFTKEQNLIIDAFIAAIITEDLIKSLGASNLIPQVGSLISGLAPAVAGA